MTLCHTAYISGGIHRIEHQVCNNIYIILFVKLQGVLLLKPECTPEGTEGSQKIIRLWVHEVYRVFYDRLVDEADRNTFFTMVKVRV